MEDTTLISVIMPNYNGGPFIGAAIESVLRQTFSNIELIIIDDKSTDKSLEIIEPYCNADKRITLIKLSKNKGVANARNLGIDAASGDYIAFLDSDDTWVEDKIERQLAIAKKGADLVCCSYDFIDENGKAIKKPFVVPEVISYKKMLSCSYISCSTGFVKASIMKEHHFKSEYYHEDYVLWMDLLKCQVIARGDAGVLAHYRIVSGSRSFNKINAAKHRWIIYRNALDMNVLNSLFYFVKYCFCGVRKYFF